MELLLELLLSAGGVLLEFLFELLIELLGGALGNVIGDRVPRAAGARERPRAWWAFVAYALLGALLGAGSLLLWPTHFMPTLAGRWAYLLLSPVVAGLVLAAVGAWRRKQGRVVLALDTFGCGWGFAFAFALVRFAGAA